VLNDTLYTGIECIDPDGDIAKYVFTLSVGSETFPLDNNLPATFKGYFCYSDMIKDNNEYGNVWQVGDDYTITITLIDSKGNKSAPVASNTFSITN
jgi:hypothetical protein